jgi:NADPH:quinone reductase-like Zn-dependent oxidoreductase
VDSFICVPGGARRLLWDDGPVPPGRAELSERKAVKACGVSEAHAEVVQLEIPEPPSPGPGQILVEVEAAGVGPWDRLLNGNGWDVQLRPPAALGVEGTGRVVAIGAGVDGIAVGDRVLAHEAPLPGGSGFWAERVLIEAAHAAICPPGLDPVAAAALPVSGLTAVQALQDLELRRGQRLLITNGNGSTGALAIQLAASMGVEVTTTASAAAVDRLRGLGATEVVDYHDENWPTKLTGGFDAALIAAPGTAADALPLVRDGGRLCSLTSDAPPEERNITSRDLYVAADATQLARLAEQVVAGTLKLAPETLPLSEGPAAFARVAAGQGNGKKIVLTLT